MKNTIKYLILFIFTHYSSGQTTFPYDVVLTPIAIPNLPGLHSFAIAQHNGKWLVIGGRKDGIHARQPFNAFPENQNNTDILVIDVATQQFWASSINGLSTGIKEQLQSTNMNFYQDENTLYLIGGYAYSNSANNHITFDKLTAIDVPNIINAIVSSNSINSYFKQISNPIFQNTGGQLGKIGNTFYLVGGHVFTGRYNPFNNPTFTQTYQTKIQKFYIDNSGSQLSFNNYTSIFDAVNLRRRDYNLVPQVFPNGEEGYTISSGVFQANANLPFLYPVDIKSNGYFPQMQFNQYLSNYHSGKIGIYDLANNRMHSLFFGGISQFYYNENTLIQDDTCPLVKTISRVTRHTDGTLTEHNFPVEMPNLKGSGAEFILNKNLPHYSNDVIKLNEITENEIIIGHLYGGIQSSNHSPFTNNQTNLTSADPTIYQVKLVYNPNLNINNIDGKNSFQFKVTPNPAKDNLVKISFFLNEIKDLDYFITSTDGRLLDEGQIIKTKLGENSFDLPLNISIEKIVIITFVLDNRFYSSQKVLIN